MSDVDSEVEGVWGLGLMGALKRIWMPALGVLLGAVVVGVVYNSVSPLGVRSRASGVLPRSPRLERGLVEPAGVKGGVTNSRELLHGGASR